MGVLAVDIETASPDGEPRDFENTDYFEIVCAGVAYWPSPSADPDTDIIFREGAWDDYHTASVMQRIHQWTADRDVDTVLTYNGSGFDVVHLLNWTERGLENEYDSDANDLINEGHATEFVDLLTSDHVDLMDPVRQKHGSMLSFEDACAEYGIETPETPYSSYDLPESIVEGEIVKNTHIGRTLGEQYALWAQHCPDTKSFNELHRLLTDYTLSDIEPMHDLAVSLDVFD